MKKTWKQVSGLVAGFLVALPAVGLAAGMLDLPRTGQQRCYNTAGTEVACSGTGQDGESRTGAPIPFTRFKDNGDGTVTDRMTGMIWLRNANCFPGKTWTPALAAISALADGQCGLSDGSKAGDWRMPNRNELMSIVDISRVNPSLQVGHPFVNVSFGMYSNSYAIDYWTSSTYTPSNTYAWAVNFASGTLGNSVWDKDSTNYSNYPIARSIAVRGGQ
jgi:hypothetical protein